MSIVIPDVRHRLGTVTAVNSGTGVATVDLGGGLSVSALSLLADLPVVGWVVWLEHRGGRRADWVVTDVQSPLSRGARTGCRLRRVAVQSINSAADTAISWDTEDEDLGGFITATSATITIPTGLGGVYAITAYAKSTANLNGRTYIDIVPTTGITGTPANLRTVISTGNNDSRYLASVTIPLLATDSFQVHVFHTIGAADNHTAWLSCYRVSP